MLDLEDELLNCLRASTGSGGFPAASGICAQARDLRRGYGRWLEARAGRAGWERHLLRRLWLRSNCVNERGLDLRLRARGRHALCASAALTCHENLLSYLPESERPRTREPENLREAGRRPTRRLNRRPPLPRLLAVREATCSLVSGRVGSAKEVRRGNV